MMNIKNLTLGIEEEYQIVHPVTRDLHFFTYKLISNQS